jgi:hypothetical protein
VCLPHGEGVFIHLSNCAFHVLDRLSLTVPPMHAFSSKCWPACQGQVRGQSGQMRPPGDSWRHNRVANRVAASVSIHNNQTPLQRCVERFDPAKSASGSSGPGWSPSKWPETGSSQCTRYLYFGKTCSWPAACNSGMIAFGRWVCKMRLTSAPRVFLSPLQFSLPMHLMMKQRRRQYHKRIRCLCMQ